MIEPETFSALALVGLLVVGWIARRVVDARETHCRQCGFDSGVSRRSFPRCSACGRLR
jgi:hypothetical protein